MSAIPPLAQRSVHRFSLRAEEFARVLDIVAGGERRALVQVDGKPIDDPRALPPAKVSAAKSIDVTSFWVNPDRPTWGRRHFVYFNLGPTGVQYFGDSTAPEVIGVCEALDGYFDIAAASAKAVAPAEGREAQSDPVIAARRRMGDGWTLEDRPFVIAVVLGVILMTLFAFFLGRWTAPGAEPPSVIPSTMPIDPSTNEPASGPPATPTVAP